MPNKKELAGSAKHGVAKNQKVGNGDGNDPANNLIAELIERIEVALAAIDFAGMTDETPMDTLRPSPVVGPVEQCHASISFVSSHQALSINLYWSVASPAACPDADDADARLPQPEAAKF